VLVQDARFILRTLLHRSGAWYEVVGASQIGPMELTSAPDPDYGSVGDPIINRLRVNPTYVGRVRIGEDDYDQQGKTISRFMDGWLEGGGRTLMSVGCSLLP
jgi:hypothetical protein